MSGPRDRPPERLAEVLASMSIATDLGLGQPMGHVVRSCLALRLAEVMDLDEAQRSASYYIALLAWVGCHAAAHEEAEWFGIDIELKRAAYPIDMKGLEAVGWSCGTWGKEHRRSIALGCSDPSSFRGIENSRRTTRLPAR